MQDLVTLLNKELTKKQASRGLAQKRVVDFDPKRTTLHDIQEFHKLTKAYLVATAEAKAFSEATQLVVENTVRIENKTRQGAPHGGR